MKNYQYENNAANNMFKQMTTNGITARSCIGFWMQSVNKDIQTHGYAFIGGSNSSYFTGALTYTPFTDIQAGFIMNRYLNIYTNIYFYLPLE